MNLNVVRLVFCVKSIIEQARYDYVDLTQGVDLNEQETMNLDMYASLNCRNDWGTQTVN